MPCRLRKFVKGTVLKFAVEPKKMTSKIGLYLKWLPPTSRIIKVEEKCNKKRGSSLGRRKKYLNLLHFKFRNKLIAGIIIIYFAIWKFDKFENKIR